MVVANWVLLGVVVAVYFVGVVLALWPSRVYDSPRVSTRILLVFLRLAIAWHFFIEGVNKLHNPSWSSEVYLRESTGPLAPAFRSLAGDTLADSLRVTADKDFPEELDREWRAYVERFDAFFGLNDEQRQRTAQVLKQVESTMKVQLSIKPKLVEKYAPYPPTLMVPFTMPERLKEYQRLQEAVVERENQVLVAYGDVEAWKAAKTSANRWRADLQKDLKFVNNQLRRALQAALLDLITEEFPGRSRREFVPQIVGASLGVGGGPLGPIAMLVPLHREGKLSRPLEVNLAKVREEAEAEIAATDAKNWDDLDRIEAKAEAKTFQAYREAFYKLEETDAESAKAKSPLSKLLRTSLLEKRGRNQPPADPLPVTSSRPLRLWTLQDWSDRLVKYGITVVGLLLLLGLGTRIACVVGAGYLLLFYLAMPPLPGWPESPRVEGHYLFINKNIIEMLALLVLASTHTGRWVGLDGLICFLLPGRWQNDNPGVTMEDTVVRRT